jgi:hypothetical protein
MSNIVSFWTRERSACEAVAVPLRAGIAAATEGDGAAFAVASGHGWLGASLQDLAERLEVAVRTLGPELAAARYDLHVPFVQGFADQLEPPARARPSGVALTVELSLTATGLAADTFCWRDETEAPR